MMVCDMVIMSSVMICCCLVDWITAVVKLC